MSHFRIIYGSSPATLRYLRRQFADVRRSGGANELRSDYISGFGLSNTLANFYWANDNLTSYAQAKYGVDEWAGAFGPGLDWVRPVTYFEIKRSFSTPGYYKLKFVPVQKLIKRKFPYERPREPYLGPFRPFKTPKPVLKLRSAKTDFTAPSGKYDVVKWSAKLAFLRKRDSERNALINKLRIQKWERKMEKWNQSLQRYESLKRRFEAAQRQRADKYRIRYDKWLQQHTLYKTKYRYVKVKQSDVLLQSLPYLKASIHSSSGEMSYLTRNEPEEFYFSRNSSGQVYSPYGGRWIDDVHAYVENEYVEHAIGTYGGNAESECLSVANMFADDLLLAARENRILINQILLDKINKGRVEVGNIIAERAQTYRMIKDKLQLIVDFVSARKRLFTFVRRQLKGGKLANAKRISNQYLEFQFGLKPLVDDLQNLLGFSGSPPVVKAKTGLRREGSFSSERFMYTGRLKVTYTLKYALNDDIVRTLSLLQLDDPASIAWETVPWSFVVDWLTPIGRFISNISATKGLTFLSYDRVITFKGTAVPKVSSAGGTGDPIGLRPNPPTYSISLKRRDTELLPPSPYLPGIKNPFSLVHGLETLALLIQRMKSRIR